MRSKAESFIAYNLASVVNVLIGYVILTFLTSQFSKAEFAEYGLLNSVFSFLLIFFNFGAKEALFKTSSQNNAKITSQVIGWFLGWQVLLLILTASIALINGLLAAVSFSFVAFAALLTTSALNRGRAKYLHDAVALPLQRTMWFIGLYTVVSLTSDLAVYQVFLASAIGTLLVTLLVIPKVDFQCFKLVQFKPPGILYKFLFIEASIIAYTRIDMLILKIFDSDAVFMAEYYFALQIFETIVLILTPLSFFFFNKYAKLKDGDGTKADRDILAYGGLLIFLVAAGHLIWFVIGEQFLNFLFPNYLDSWQYVNMFFLALYPLSLNLIFSSYLIVRHHEIKYAIVCFSALVIYFALGLLSVSAFQASNIIYVRVAVESFIALSLFFLVKKQLNCYVSSNNL